jgi:hypothetical protein
VPEDLESPSEQLMLQSDCGVVHLKILRRQRGASVDEALTASAKGAGLLSRPHRAVHPEEARRIALMVLSRDLAYGSERVPPELASDVAARFFESFADDARFFTNGTFRADSGELQSWTPITAATFDTGVFAIDGRSVGYVWVEDED